jgi:hypothetical protein
MKKVIFCLVFTLLTIKVRAIDAHFIRLALENPGDTIPVQEYNADIVFPKFLGMKDFFHAETTKFAPLGIVSLENEIVYVKNYIYHETVLAWWNIIGVVLLLFNILFRSFRKLLKNKVEPEFFMVVYFISGFVCLVPLILQIFCNIFMFDWRMLIAMTMLFLASLYSGMIDFDFLSEEDEEMIFINHPPTKQFIFLMIGFFISQFIIF